MERHFKTEGILRYPSESTLTWGPFYYHNEDKAKAEMEKVMKYIVDWVNEKDPTLDIKPTNVMRTRCDKQIIFEIKAWRDDEHLDDCNGIITVDEIFFED